MAQRGRVGAALGLVVAVSSLVLVITAVPTHGQGPAEAVDRAAEARESYGLPTDRSFVRQLKTSADDDATERYGFPLTRVEQADLVARTAYGQAFAAETLPYVERLKGYGGVWLDQQDGGRMVVGLTKVDATAKRQVRARLPRANLGVRFARVQHSAAELGRALKRADRDWTALRTGIRPQAFAISYRENRLVVKVLPAQLGRARRAAAPMSRRAGVGVAVKPSARVTDSACSTRQRCFGPLRLGVRINHGAVYRARDPLSQWSCAIGFMLSNHTILTAGHCAHRHAGPWHGHAAYRSRYGRIGRLRSSRYTSKHRDLAIITLEDWRANRTTRIFGDTWPTRLTQPGRVVEDMDVCVSLARHDRFWCGRVTEPKARWWSSTAGIWVQGAGMRFNAPGRTPLPGDSGSPVVAMSKPCPMCTPLQIPIGIATAGNEADRGARSGSGQLINADLYFAEVAWALEQPGGWPWLDIYTGPKPTPDPTPSPVSYGLARAARVARAIGNAWMSGAFAAVVLAALLVLIPGAAGAAEVTPSACTAPVAFVADADTAATTVPPVDLSRGTWRPMARAPFGSEYEPFAWTGRQLLVFDDDSGRTARYTPSRDRWREASRAPRRFDSTSRWAWTGHELVILEMSGDGGMIVGAAYDPGRDRWREIASLDAVVDGDPDHALADALWSGTHVIVADSLGLLAAYDPAADCWVELGQVPGVPWVWRLYAGGPALLAESRRWDQPVEMRALDLATMTWSEPVQGPLDREVSEGGGVWLDDRLVYLTWYPLDEAAGAANAIFLPATMSWSTFEHACTTSASGTLAVDGLLVASDLRRALDGTTFDCIELPAAPRRLNGTERLVWTGDELIAWSGIRSLPEPPRRGGLILRPTEVR